MIERKIEFFGKLNQSKYFAELALKDIKYLWESGEIRLLPDDIKEMNKTIREAKKILNQVLKYNHDKFGVIVLEESNENNQL